jgi:hypothetical protein
MLAAGNASFEWPKTLLMLSDGTSELPVTVFEQAPYTNDAGARARIASVAGDLHPHGVAANAFEVVVYLERGEHGATSVVGLYRYADGGRAGEVEIHPDDRFAPKTRTSGPDGHGTWAASAQTIALGDRGHVVLDERPAPPGLYAVGFRVTDYAAYRRLATVPVALP